MTAYGRCDTTSADRKMFVSRSPAPSNADKSNLGSNGLNTSGPVFRPQRERQILDNLASENSGPLPEEHLRSIWHEIFASSRTLQRPVSVAYLGPEGTNSYFAAVDLLGNLMD